VATPPRVYQNKVAQGGAQGRHNSGKGCPQGCYINGGCMAWEQSPL